MSQSITFSISVPSDGDGFVGRACDAPGCKQYFKVFVPDTKDTLHCPYCGQSFNANSLLTRDQTDHVQRVVQEEARVYAVQEFQKALKKAVRGSKFVKYNPAPPPRKRDIAPQYVERTVDTELQCVECKTRFQIYGIFGYCPGCNCENLQIYDTNLAIIKQNLESEQDRNRQLRHAYGDLVSTFEAFCARKAKQITPELGNFQVLFDARKFFKQHASVDMLANLSTSDLLALRRVFQKRHVCSHAGGMITDRYVRMIPEDAGLLGTQASLLVEEFDDAARAMRVALGDLVKAIERPG